MPSIRRFASLQAAFIFVFITVTLDMIALGIIVPVLPKLIIEFKGGDIRAAAVVTGVFGAAWAAMQFVFSPLVGAASDRFGRRPVILLSNLGLGLDYLIMAWSPTLMFLFFGRLISGITASSYPTACAYTADVTAPEARAARFGMLGAAFGLGFIIGPALGGVLGAIDLRLPFWVAGGLSIANALYGFLVLPESLPRERRVQIDWRKANPMGSLGLLRKHPEVFALACALFLLALAHESLPSIFVLYTDFRYRWSERTVGLALAAIGICSTLVAAGLIRPAVNRFKEHAVMIAGLIFGVTGFVTFGLAPTGSILMMGLPFISLWGLANPAMQSLMSRRIDASAQGQLQGALGSLRGIAGMIGPLLFTQTFAAAIALNPTHPIPGAAYLLAGGLIFLALLLCLNITRKHSRATYAPLGNLDAGEI